MNTEKAVAPHSSTLAWKIPWTEEAGGLQSMGLLRVRHDWATSFSLLTFHFHALEKEMATHSSVLAWRIPGTGKPRGLPSMESHRVGHDWRDLVVVVVMYVYVYACKREDWDLDKSTHIVWYYMIHFYIGLITYIERFSI